MPIQLSVPLFQLDGNTRSLGREALEWYVQARYLHVDALLPGGDLSGVHVVACDACPEEAIAVAVFERYGKTVFPALSERPHRVAAEGRELPKRIAFQVGSLCYQKHYYNGSKCLIEGQNLE